MFGVAVVALGMGAVVAIWLMVQLKKAIAMNRKQSTRGVLKQDWVPTGRIDFETGSKRVKEKHKDRPGEFKLLIEERRIVESLFGNDIVEFQWRHATLSEVKTVVSRYHKLLLDNHMLSTPTLPNVSSYDQQDLSIVPKTNGVSEPSSKLSLVSKASSTD